MDHRTLLPLLLALAALGCDGGSDDAASGCCGGTEIQDLTAYEDDVAGVFEHTFSGTIEDYSSEVSCRFDGDQFALTIDVAPPSNWECTGSEGQDADCTHAVRAALPLSGELEIDAVYQVTGIAGLFENCDLIAGFTTDLPCYRNSLGDGMLDCVWFDSEISQLNWAIQPDEEHTDEWEACMLNVESIE